MTDGFSEPDPAPMPDDSQEFDMDDLDLSFEKKSCHGCIHFTVCAYYAGIAPMLEQREKAPIEPEDLAIICAEYTPHDDLV